MVEESEQVETSQTSPFLFPTEECRLLMLYSYPVLGYNREVVR